mgnify:FL=1
MLYAPKYQTYWVICSHLEPQFPTPRWFSLGAVPRSLASSGSSSYELYLPYRVRSCLSPARCPRALGAFLEVSFPFATLACGVHYSPGSHTRLRSALSVSHALDGLLLLTPCGLVSSHCHVRDSLFRGFLRCQAGSSHRRVVPSCRYRVSSHGELPRRCRFHSLRLQGVDPSSDPLWPAGGLDLPTTRSPLGLSTPAGLSPATLETPSRPLRS